MINYELAKQLKDAGFPFREIRLVREFSGDAQYLHPVQPLMPNLSELIEACGEGFASLRRINQPNNSIWWNCTAIMIPSKQDEFSLSSCSMGGDTPEKAVANLWLSLNKK